MRLQVAWRLANSSFMEPALAFGVDDAFHGKILTATLNASKVLSDSEPGLRWHDLISASPRREFVLCRPRFSGENQPGKSAYSK
jgi:hypothetical protein